MSAQPSLLSENMHCSISTETNLKVSISKTALEQPVLLTNELFTNVAFDTLKPRFVF